STRSDIPDSTPNSSPVSGCSARRSRPSASKCQCAQAISPPSRTGVRTTRPPSSAGTNSTDFWPDGKPSRSARRGCATPVGASNRTTWSRPGNSTVRNTNRPADVKCNAPTPCPVTTNPPSSRGATVTPGSGTPRWSTTSKWDPSGSSSVAVSRNRNPSVSRPVSGDSHRCSASATTSSGNRCVPGKSSWPVPWGMDGTCLSGCSPSPVCTWCASPDGRTPRKSPDAVGRDDCSGTGGRSGSAVSRTGTCPAVACSSSRCARPRSSSPRRLVLTVIGLSASVCSGVCQCRGARSPRYSGTIVHFGVRRTMYWRLSPAAAGGRSSSEVEGEPSGISCTPEASTAWERSMSRQLA
ncbi:LOW QUALITY PROTEIN: translation initiation factor IF-2, partial [Kutzneria sp. 744]